MTLSLKAMPPLLSLRDSGTVSRKQSPEKKQKYERLSKNQKLNL